MRMRTTNRVPWVVWWQSKQEQVQVQVQVQACGWVLREVTFPGRPGRPSYGGYGVRSCVARESVLWKGAGEGEASSGPTGARALHTCLPAHFTTYSLAKYRTTSVT